MSDLDHPLGNRDLACEHKLGFALGARSECQGQKQVTLSRESGSLLLFSLILDTDFLRLPQSMDLPSISLVLQSPLAQQSL
jgi:hypothetical protein